MQIVRWIRRRWWQFRHEVYYYEVPVPPPISGPTGGDDTAMIQNAINVAAREPEWFTHIYAAYTRKWYRAFLKNPVLNASTRFQAGTYMVSSPLVIGDNFTIQGEDKDSTSIRQKPE
jgi:hypothetical protein